MDVGGKPGASLRGWHAYFSRAEIYRADIDSDICFDEGRIHTSWTDVTDPHAVRSLWDKLADIRFDIIIDDGLHEVSADIRFFLESFGKLKPGGLYVIDDILPSDVDLMGAFARYVGVRF